MEPFPRARPRALAASGRDRPAPSGGRLTSGPAGST